MKANSKTLFILIALFAIVTMVFSSFGTNNSFAREHAQDSRPQINFDQLVVSPTGSRQVNENASLASQPKTSSGQTRYLIQLQDEPVSSYRGGVSGLAATNPAVLDQARLDAGSPASRAYASYLQRQQAAFVSAAAQSINRSPQVLHQYQYALNGVALEITSTEAAQLAQIPGVKWIEPDYINQITTDAGPTWIGAPTIWEGDPLGSPAGTYGEGIIVGVLDTGINLDHLSFAEVSGDGYVHQNPYGDGNFVGWCDPANSNYDHAYVCNNKLIGAWDFSDASWGDSDGPEDDDGHGSHTSSTAAGNVIEATMLAPTTSATAWISGVAPRANLIMYDVCGGPGCYDSDVVAGIERAILDGVDVLNESISIGGDSWYGNKQQAYLGAFDAGIVAVRSAGNSGPGAATVGPEPAWTLSTAATTHNRNIVNSLVNMAGGAPPVPVDIQGAGFTSAYGPASIVDAADYGDPLCAPGAFAPSTFNGEIVVCMRGGGIARVDKGQSVLDGGAGGMVLVDDGGGLVGDPHVLPAVHISAADGASLLTWLGRGVDHVANIAGYLMDTRSSNGDIMAGFSSRGPGEIDIIKPDVAAPGVDIWAAVNTVDPTDPPEYGLKSGTSMASPHMAGAAALMRAIHPDWPPAQIRSALMTSSTRANTRKEDGATRTDPFDVGAGRASLSSAMYTGLVLDVTTDEYETAAVSGDARSLNLPSMQNSQCYQNCGWTRTVTNPTDVAMQWRASYSGAGSATITPSTFSVLPGASATISLDLDVLGLETETWHFGYLTLTETTGLAPVVVMPVAVQPLSSTDANLIIKLVDQDEAVGGDILNYSIRLQNLTPATKTVTVTDTVPVSTSYVDASATGGFTYDSDANNLTWSGELPPSNLEIQVYPSGSFLSMSIFVPPTACPSNCDEGGFLISGLDVYYLGEHYTSAIWSVNGTLELGTASGLTSSWANTSLPNPALPNNLLAPWWTDLDLSAGGNWYLAGLTDGINNFTVFSWENVPLYGAAGTSNSFQIWMVDGTDTIWYAYNGVTGPSGTVGAEDATGTLGATYYFNGAGTLPTAANDLDVVGIPGEPVSLGFQAEIVCSTETEIFNEAHVDDGTTVNSAYTLTDITAYSRVQVAHLAPFAADSSATITLNGVPALTDFAFADSTGYLNLVSGSCGIDVFPQGSDTPAISETVTLLPDLEYTVIAIGDGANQPLDLKFLQDDNSSPSTGNVKLRLGHLAPFADTPDSTLVDLRFQDGTLVLNDLPYEEIEDYLEFQAAKFDFKFTTPDGLTVLIDPVELTLGAGRIRSIFAVGDATHEPLGVFVLPNGSPGSLLTLAQYGVSLLPASQEVYGLQGEVVESTLTLTNTGNTTDTYNLVLSDTAQGWDADLPVTSFTLEGGASTQVTVQVTIPTDAEVGDSDTLTVTATSVWMPSVTTSANVTTRFLDAEYGVSLLPAFQEGYGLPGRVIDYTLTLTNTGNVTDTIDLSLSAIADRWDAELSDTSFTLASAETTQVTVSVTIPSDAMEGESFAAFVTATSQGDESVTSSATLTTLTISGKIFMPMIMQ